MRRHWHGIEPDPRNDGVGHTSFEVNGAYTYQLAFGAAERYEMLLVPRVRGAIAPTSTGRTGSPGR